MFSAFGYYNYQWYKNSFTAPFVEIGIHLFWVNSSRISSSYINNLSFQTVVQSGSILLPSPQQCIEFQSFYTLTIMCLFHLSYPGGYKWYFIGLLICISQMANNIKHLCLGLFFIHISFMKSLFKSYVHFYLCVFCLPYYRFI